MIFAEFRDEDVVASEDRSDVLKVLEHEGLIEKVFNTTVTSATDPTISAFLSIMTCAIAILVYRKHPVSFQYETG